MRGAFVVSVSIVLAACGGKPAPTPVGPVTNTGPAGPAAPAGDPVAFDIAGTPWELAVPGAQHSQPDEYTHRFTHDGWTIDVVEWPDSQVFVQTLDQELVEVRARDAAAEVLYQHADSDDAWADVVRSHGRINGGRKIHGQLNVMCTFELAGDADWHAALDACGKVNNAIEEVEPGEGD